MHHRVARRRLKISHVDPHVVTTILNLLDAKYGHQILGGERATLTVTCGKIHDYLGMTLNYSDPGVVKINMTDYTSIRCSKKHPATWTAWLQPLQIKPL
jgi:hypothetical protein